jgi:hypothetical protein
MYFKLFGKLFLSVLPHFNIAMAVTMLVLYVTDQYNRAMAFINNDITKGMLAVFCITVVIEGIAMSISNRKIAQARNDAINASDNANTYGDQ